MIEQTLKELESKITKASSIPKHKQVELITLLNALRSEIVVLSKTKGDEAESIAGFTKVSTHEAVRQKKNQQLLDLSLEGLSSSVKELEVSHPKLVQMVNSICSMLANMGM